VKWGHLCCSYTFNNIHFLYFQRRTRLPSYSLLSLSSDRVSMNQSRKSIKWHRCPLRSDSKLVWTLQVVGDTTKFQSTLLISTYCNAMTHRRTRHRTVAVGGMSYACRRHRNHDDVTWYVDTSGRGGPEVLGTKQNYAHKQLLREQK
jgi:hypothetical protein